MRISDWSSDVCSSDHAVQALRALQFLDPEFAQEHLEIIDNAWHHRLDAGLIGRLLEFEADAQLHEARLASPAVEADQHLRSEEHTSELQSLMRISYAVFCLQKKNHTQRHSSTNTETKQDMQL